MFFSLWINILNIINNIVNPFKNIGGIRSILYSINIGRKVGLLKLFKVLSSKNTCKTCALGMGGQNGGMRNEQGHWLEICKKSIQAFNVKEKVAVIYYLEVNSIISQEVDPFSKTPGFKSGSYNIKKPL